MENLLEIKNLTTYFKLVDRRNNYYDECTNNEYNIWCSSSSYN